MSDNQMMIEHEEYDVNSLNYRSLLLLGRDDKLSFEEHNIVINRIIQDNDTIMAFLWAYEVESGVEELFEVVLNNFTLDAEKYHVRAVAKWLGHINYRRNSELKIRAIEYNMVEELMSLIFNSTFKAFSMQDFYKDLPAHYQLGVIL